MTVAMHGLWLQCLTVPGSGTLSLVLSFVHRREQGFWVGISYPLNLVIWCFLSLSFTKEDGCLWLGVNGSIFKKKKEKERRKTKIASERLLSGCAHSVFINKARRNSGGTHRSQGLTARSGSNVVACLPILYQFFKKLIPYGGSDNTHRGVTIKRIFNFS